MRHDSPARPAEAVRGFGLLLPHLQSAESGRQRWECQRDCKSSFISHSLVFSQNSLLCVFFHTQDLTRFVNRVDRTRLINDQIFDVLNVLKKSDLDMQNLSL